MKNPPTAKAVQDALARQQGRIELAGKRLSCDLCRDSQLPNRYVLRLPPPASACICMGCVLKCSAGKLPEAAKQWTPQQVVSLLEGAAEQRLEAMAACQAYGMKKPVAWYDRYETPTPLCTHVSIFRATLACLSWPGNDYLAALVRGAARHRLAFLLRRPETQPHLWKIDPAATPHLAQAALGALDLPGLAIADQVKWLSSFENCGDEKLAAAALRKLRDLQVDDFAAAETQARNQPLIDEMVHSFILDQLKPIAVFFQRVTGMALQSGSKEKICRTLVNYFARPGGKQEFYARLSEPQRKLFEFLVWKKKPEAATVIERELGFPVVVAQRVTSFSYGKQHVHYGLAKDFEGLVDKHSSYGYLPEDFRVRLNSWYVEQLKPCVPLPAGATIRGSDQPPAGQEIVVHHFDPTLVNSASALEALFFQQVITFKADGSPTVAGLRQLLKVGGHAEFFPAMPELALARTELLGRLLALVPAPELPRTDTEAIMRLWLETLTTAAVRRKRGKGSETRRPSGLELCTGFVRGDQFCDGDPAEQAILERLVGLAKAMPSGKWVSCKEIFDYLLYNDLELPLPPSFKFAWVRVDRDWGQQKVGLREDLEAYWRQPLVRAFLFALAALGALDVALAPPHNPLCDKQKTPYFGPGDGIQAIRLSPLGEWFFHGRQVDCFQPSAAGTIHLDPRRLLIRLQGRDPVLKLTLEQIAQPVGDGFYRLDAATFLRNCHSRAEIEKKVQAIKSLLPDHLPPVWQTFFASLLERIDPLKKCSHIVLELKEGAELQRLFLADPTLKEVALKAEGRRILVSQGNLKRLKKRLGELGYFVDSL